MESQPMTAPTDILRSWPSFQPETVTATHRGTNNLTYRVESPQGAFILKVMLNVTDPACLAALHRLLATLQAMDPGFAVPAPLPSIDGSTIVAIDGTPPRLCVLTPAIPGSHPDVSDIGHVTAAARALGRLHRALARIPDPERYPCGLRVDTFTQKTAVFGGPDALLGRIGLPESTTADLLRILGEATATIESMDMPQPAQIIHSDYYPSNVLVADGEVSGILDFEFVVLGPRVYDVALGMWAFTFLWDIEDASAWQRAEAFLAAYASVIPLAPDEWRHLADFIVIADVHSLLHWSGRFIGGLVSLSEMEGRARRLIEMDQWVERHRERLTRLAERVTTA
jgi:homoserine kinase type II